MLSTGALIAAGVIGAAGAGASALKRSQAQQEELRSYKAAQDYLTSQYYRDPLSTVGNRSLLKQMKEAHEDDIEALENRAVAGGATMENALAMRQKSNEAVDKVYGTLLQGEDARRQAIDNQRMQLDQRHSQNVQGGFLQAAQDWQSWGAAGAQAALSLGSTSLLDGGTVADAGLTDPDLGNIYSGGLKGVYTDKMGALRPTKQYGG